MTRLGGASALVLLAFAALLPQRALADQRWSESGAAWKAMDKCTRAAIKAYPDYTPESLAKRAAQRRLCLRSANLPDGDEPAPRPR